MHEDPDLDEIWPRADDDLTAIGPRSRLVAWFNLTHDEPWIGYVEGFRRLADLGVAHCEATGRGHDFLVYPVVFAYRHHIELALKMTIRDVSDLLDVEHDQPGTHKLLPLWEVAEPLLRQVADDGETYAAVRQCLRRFDELDPSAESFRYPVTRRGVAVLPDLHNST